MVITDVGTYYMTIIDFSIREIKEITTIQNVPVWMSICFKVCVAKDRRLREVELQDSLDYSKVMDHLKAICKASQELSSDRFIDVLQCYLKNAQTIYNLPIKSQSIILTITNQLPSIKLDGLKTSSPNGILNNDNFKDIFRKNKILSKILFCILEGTVNIGKKQYQKGNALYLSTTVIGNIEFSYDSKILFINYQS